MKLRFKPLPKTGMNRRKKAALLFGLCLAALFAVAVGGLLCGQEARVTDFSRKDRAPCLPYPFGTDWLGRDMLARSLAGLSVSIRIGLCTAGIGALLALLLGSGAALLGKRVDACISFMIDAVLGIPHMLLLILISYACGKGFRGVVLGVSLTHWPSLARLIRAEVLQLKESEYVLTAGKLGVGKVRIALRHMIPHLLPQFLTGLILMFPHAVLHEAGITFLGFGLPPEQPAIGIILSESMRYLITGKWWLALFPGLLLISVVALFDVAGNSLRNVLDPAGAQDPAGASQITLMEDMNSHTRIHTAPSRKRSGMESSMGCENGKPILEITHLSVSFLQYTKGFGQGYLPVISGLDVDVCEGEIVAVVGASGSGKSLLAHAVLGLLPSNASWNGEISFRGKRLDEKEMEKLRGKKIALVPQSVDFLDPLMKVGRQVQGSGGKRERQRELFRKYGLSEETEGKYPFECSGGMCRRILLATALMEEPDLIIADEPTPGLDPALARTAMEDFRSFADRGNGVLLITHDIELALEVADRIAVFYAGTMVEEAPAADFASEGRLRHPYTRALWRAMPKNGFRPIEGNQPYAGTISAGCVFRPRCPYAVPACEGEIPLYGVRGGRVRCVRDLTEGLA